jgi:hypothetical protein
MRVLEIQQDELGAYGSKVTIFVSHEAYEIFMEKIREAKAICKAEDQADKETEEELRRELDLMDDDDWYDHLWEVKK